MTVDPSKIPPMPTDWQPQTRIPVRGDADRRFHWMREHGYRGPIDQDGHAVIEPHRATVPGSWWIALDGYGDPCVWAPTAAHPDRPDCMLWQRMVYPAVWAIFATVLPDRGACGTCTATPCDQHATLED